MNNSKPQDLKIYEVINRATGIRHFSASYNAEDACKQAGWSIGDCYVIEQMPRWKPVPGHDSILLVKVPCLTCPFQYGECKKPETEECPTRPSSPELQNWLKQAAEARLCPYVGASLRKNDYNLGQKWVSMLEAIKELVDHR